MEIYTIGFAKKPARRFFGLLSRAGIRRLLDVRLNNRSQLAGFTKRDDLEYFLQAISGISYEHRRDLAPDKPLLDDYRHGRITWPQYAEAFTDLLRHRRVDETLDERTFAEPTVLLCTEPTAERCHRRLIVDYLADAWGGITARHL